MRTELTWRRRRRGYSGGGGGFYQVQQGGRVTVTLTLNPFDSEAFRMVNSAPMPIPRSPSGFDSNGLPKQAPPKDATEAQKRKDDCMNGCSVQYQIMNNNNIVAISELRSSLGWRPVQGAVIGGVLAAVLTTPIDMPGIWIAGSSGWYLGSSAADRQIADQTAALNAVAATAWNTCMNVTCKSWFMLLGLPLPLVRRRRDVA